MTFFDFIGLDFKKAYTYSECSDARGLGNTVPCAPPGLSRKGPGVEGNWNF